MDVLEQRRCTLRAAGGRERQSDEQDGNDLGEQVQGAASGARAVRRGDRIRSRRERVRRDLRSAATHAVRHAGMRAPRRRDGKRQTSGLGFQSRDGSGPTTERASRIRVWTSYPLPSRFRRIDDHRPRSTNCTSVACTSGYLAPVDGKAAVAARVPPPPTPLSVMSHGNSNGRVSRKPTGQTR
jgi:hypothetical protein